MRLHRAGGARLLPAAYGIPWVPEIPRQWRRGTEPGVTAVTNVFGIPDDPAVDNDAARAQPREGPPPPSELPTTPPATTTPRAHSPGKPARPPPELPTTPPSTTTPRAHSPGKPAHAPPRIPTGRPPGRSQATPARLPRPATSRWCS